MHLTVVAVAFVLPTILIGQQLTPGPQPAIVLEWADSLRGAGGPEETTREFLGNVRFRQGNVTVRCDRAIHDINANQAKLFGNVVVNQGSMTIKAPYILYDGNAYVAYADQGIRVEDSTRTLTALHGTYSTKTHEATFTDSVLAVDDTLTVWSDHARYNRDAKTSSAWSRVVVHDTSEHAWMRTDSLYHDSTSNELRMIGNSAVWQCKEDTLFIIADTIFTKKRPTESYTAIGNVELVRGRVAARADSIDFSDTTGISHLLREPAIWADSMLLMADTITVYAPNRKLHSVIGVGNGFMVSRSDSVRTERYDQISGDSVDLELLEDTVRSLISVGQAKSITWRVEENQPQGLAQFASDTIKAYFLGGKPEDIYWLGGIQGQHYPENIAAGKEADYRLPGFAWRTDRPIMRPLPMPYSAAPIRTQPSYRVKNIEASTGKKK